MTAALVVNDVITNSISVPDVGHVPKSQLPFLPTVCNKADWEDREEIKINKWNRSSEESPSHAWTIP